MWSCLWVPEIAEIIVKLLTEMEVFIDFVLLG